jgi:hypothetical protein
MTFLLILLQAIACQTNGDILCLEPEPRVEPDLAVCKQAALYDATASIGTGEGQFEVYAPLDLLHAIAGPQGGHHFHASVWVVGLNPGVKVNGEPLGCPVSIYDTVRADYTHHFPDDLVAPIVTTTLREMIGTVAGAFFIGEYIYIDLPDLQEQYPDLTEIEVQASVTVTDKCGTTVEDSRPLLLSLYDVR